MQPAQPLGTWGTGLVPAAALALALPRSGAGRSIRLGTGLRAAGGCGHYSAALRRRCGGRALRALLGLAPKLLLVQPGQLAFQLTVFPQQPSHPMHQRRDDLLAATGSL